MEATIMGSGFSVLNLPITWVYIYIYTHIDIYIYIYICYIHT